MIDSILPFLFAHVILVLGLRYTRPSSLPRYFLQAIIFVCCFISVRSTFSLSIPAQAGGQYIWGMMMSSSHWMLLAHASSATHAPPGKELNWAIEMLFSARWGVSSKMIPPFCRKDRSYVPTKARFLLTRSWNFIWTAGLLYLMNKYQLYIYDSDFTSVPDGFLHRLGDVSPTEWVIRIYMTIVGKGAPYLALRAGHSLVSVLAITAGDSPERYPPLFGSIKEAYRVRRFYVYFWHHLVRKPFTTHASLIVNDIFRVPRQTATSRYLVLACSFIISAWMHVFVAPNIPLRCQVWPQLRFYLSIAGAIIFEDLVTFAYRRLNRKKASQLKPNDNVIESEAHQAKVSSRDDGRAQDSELKGRGKAEMDEKNPTIPSPEQAIEPTPIIFRTIGYIWVAFFEVWSTSKSLYLIRQCLAT